MRDVDDGKPAVRPEDYSSEAASHPYMERLADIATPDADKMLHVGVDVHEAGRCGTFIQKDRSIIHCKSCQDGISVLPISDAQQQYDWLASYVWKHLSKTSDPLISEDDPEGYFIYARPGARSLQPVQSCLYIAEDGFAQNVHNVVIADEGSDLHVITGCATAPTLQRGLHVGVSEFYVKKGARLTFTMIHDWGEKINVRPRTTAEVEAGGVLVSNYISLKPVGSLQMFPTAYLNGNGAVARFNSVLIASRGCHLDVGSRVVLSAPESRAEIVSRGITSGGTIIARGDLIGKVAGIKAHLECKGLILNNGIMHAIPELQGHVPGVEMSHEAAVGKIDPREIEYLMARGLDEETAVSTIVRGFLNVDIKGLPAVLERQLEQAVAETQKDML